MPYSPNRPASPSIPSTFTIANPSQAVFQHLIAEPFS